MIRINLIEKQSPKHIRELDTALKEFQIEYDRIMRIYVKQPEYFMITKEESNLRLLGYTETEIN